MFHRIIPNDFVGTIYFLRFLSVLVFLLFPGAALSHSAERGLVMLLPTGYYIAGGALAVLITFILVSLARTEWLAVLVNYRRAIFSLPVISNIWSSNLSFLLLLLLVIAGLTGSSDPLSNPLPLFIWTLWWVGFTLLQFLVGNLWNHLNPWSGPVWLLRRFSSLKIPPFKFPRALGYSPAILFYFGFIWFELVDLAPENPPRLAIAISIYWSVHFIGILLFGEQTWRSRAEPFSIFFRLVGHCSPLVRERHMDAKLGRQKVRFYLTWPGRSLVFLPALTLSGTLFVLLTLSSVSFDGFSKTFTWLSWTGINPLDFPGRSVVQFENTLGICLGFTVLATLFSCAVLFGGKIATGNNQGSGSAPWVAASGRLVYSIIPISIAFHLAHYLTVLLVNGQYALIAFADPFNMGWTSDSHALHVTTSFLSNIYSVSIIWTIQTVVIVIGHILGIVVAHLIAKELYHSSNQSMWVTGISQAFMAILMVGYTVFGLWLLSTASIG